jgi:hypothetical protein
MPLDKIIPHPGGDRRVTRQSAVRQTRPRHRAQRRDPAPLYGVLKKTESLSFSPPGGQAAAQLLTIRAQEQVAELDDFDVLGGNWGQQREGFFGEIYVREDRQP